MVSFWTLAAQSSSRLLFALSDHPAREAASSEGWRNRLAAADRAMRQSHVELPS